MVVGRVVVGFGTVEEGAADSLDCIDLGEAAADIPGCIDLVEDLEEDILLVVAGMENLPKVSNMSSSPMSDVANLRPCGGAP